jgi:formylglycine-generating enzyme
VDGGTFGRSYDASGNETGVFGFQASPSAAPAQISAFSADAFEVTVGRFRRFVDAWPRSRPSLGAGAKGEFGGWEEGFDSQMPLGAAEFRTKLNCHAFATWTDAPDTRETSPINCVTWYEAVAFCLWDGGRLPSEAEWNYVAAGGPEQRAYPWSDPAADFTTIYPSSLAQEPWDPTLTHASFSPSAGTCSVNSNSDCSISDITPVGKFPLGKGRWAHYDLAGNMREWVLDSLKNYDLNGPPPNLYDYPPGPCIDCVVYDPIESTFVIARGGAYDRPRTELRTAYRFGYPPATRTPTIGFRCVR